MNIYDFYNGVIVFIFIILIIGFILDLKNQEIFTKIKTWWYNQPIQVRVLAQAFAIALLGLSMAMICIQ